MCPPGERRPPRPARASWPRRTAGSPLWHCQGRGIRGERRADGTLSSDLAGGRRAAARRCRYRWDRRPFPWASFVALCRLLAEPLAMELPGPAAGDRTAGHGADGALHPDSGIEVDDPDTDDDHGGNGVSDGRDALLLDGEGIAELRLPHHDTAGEERQNTDRHEPEDELLPGVVAPHLRKVLVARRQYVANPVHPLGIALVPDVVAPEADEESGEGDDERDAQPRMQDARPHAAAKEAAE